jgi:hypothetical protein
MSEDGERDPWRWINRTSSLLTEKPYNGDLIGMLLSDGQIISVCPRSYCCLSELSHHEADGGEMEEGQCLA